jgi:hypothetical protein
MHETKLPAKEVVLRNIDELNDMFEFDYLDIIKNSRNETIDSMYKSMLDKKLLS